MRARTRTNVLLLALAAALGAVILLLPEPGTGRPPPAVDFEADTVESLTLRRLDRTEPIRLERRNGDWFATAPTGKEIDGGRVGRALAALRMRTSSCYPASGQEREEFGLDPPQATLATESVTVEFGYRAPDGRRYIRAQGRLCLVEDLTLPILTGQLTDAGTD